MSFDFTPQQAPDVNEFMLANPHAFGPEATLGDVNPDQPLYVHEKDKSIGMFYSRAIEDKIHFRETGKRRYMRVPYCTIRQPGEQLNIIDRPATELDKARFGHAWERFCKRTADGPDGTPLEALFPFHPEIVASLKVNGCPTLESLADMSDTAIAGFSFGGVELRAKAQRYLLAIANPDGVKEVQTQAEMEAIKAQNRDLSTIIEEQKRALIAMEERLAAVEGSRLRPPPGEGDKAAGAAIEASVAAAATRQGRR